MTKRPPPTRAAITALALATCAVPAWGQSLQQQFIRHIHAETGIDMSLRTVEATGQSLKSAGFERVERRFDPTVVPSYEIWDPAGPLDRPSVTIWACQADLQTLDQISVGFGFSNAAAQFTAALESATTAGLLIPANDRSRSTIMELHPNAARPDTPPADDDHGAMRYAYYFFHAHMQNGTEINAIELGAAFQCPPLY